MYCHLLGAELTRIARGPSDVDGDRGETVKDAKSRLDDQADHTDGVNRGVVLADIDDGLQHDPCEWNPMGRSGERRQ